MLSFYPAHLQALFTNRERELAVLEQATTDLGAGWPRHLALIGMRRIGKSLLLWEHIARMLAVGDQAVRPVYVDFEEAVTSPELFSRRYVGLVTFWALSRGQGDRAAFLSPGGLLRGPGGGLRSVAQVLGALDGAADDPGAQVALALDFPEQLAEELDCRMLVVLDEFTELEVLANYPAVRRPFQVFRATMQRQSRLGYVIAASAVRAVEALVRDGRSPLFLQFQPLEMAAFPPDATLALAERILGNTPAPGAGRRLQALTGGHPFYIQAVASRLRQLDMASGGREPWTGGRLDADDVSRAFVMEALGRTGQIYNYCRYVYDVSLGRARGYGSLKAILQVLAEEDGLTLSEIARRVRRSAPTVREYLRALEEVDLVVAADDLYRYRDPVLRYWVAALIRGLEVDVTASRKTLAPLVADLEAQQARLTSELGVAKESQLRELMRAFAGQVVPGLRFGQEEDMTLPRFARVEPYQTPDGQLEVDALGETDEGARWAVELKWRGRASGRKELESLAARAETVRARAWFVSRGGFTAEARAYASAHGMLISARADLEQIERLVLVPEEPGNRRHRLTVHGRRRRLGRTSTKVADNGPARASAVAHSRFWPAWPRRAGRRRGTRPPPAGHRGRPSRRGR